ncbi:MAG: METTL5 family protein [Candidatus Methanosuratincola sp.]|jgi:putative methylase|nr:METTL5 family protein [Candidatus Methanosuratincola sp.]
MAEPSGSGLEGRHPPRSKRELEILLETIREFEGPNIAYEQYRLPAQLAAEVIWYIEMRHRDIQGKRIVDLGCGTGMLTAGAALMGADYVVGVDIDIGSILKAKEACKALSLASAVDFVNSEVSMLELDADVVVQNPPFGVRVRGADRAFIRKSLEIASKVYSIHKGGEAVMGFVSAFVAECGGRIDEVVPLKIKLSPTYHFHKKRSYAFEAHLFRIVRDRQTCLKQR